MTYILVNKNNPLDALCVTRDGEGGAVRIVAMSLRDAVRVADGDGEHVDIVPYDGRPEGLQFLTDDLGEIDLRGEEEGRGTEHEEYDVFSLDEDEPEESGSPVSREAMDAILDGIFQDVAAGASCDLEFDVDVDEEEVDSDDLDLNLGGLR